MRAALVLAALGLIAASGVPGLFFGRRSPVGERVACFLLVVGSVLGLFVALGAMAQPVSLARAWLVPGGELAVRVDGLAAMFLVPLFVVAPLGSIYGLEYWPQRDHADDGRKLRLFYGLQAAGIGLVLVAANAVLFLVAWETMALAAFFCITTEDRDEAVRRTGYIYLVATRMGTLLLFAMFAVLHAASGTWDFAAPGRSIAPSAATAVFRSGAPRLRHQGRTDAAPRLAPRGARQRAESRFLADVRRHDQDRHLRVGWMITLLGPTLRPGGDWHAHRCRDHVGRPRRAVCSRAARPQAAARLPQRGEHWDHRPGPAWVCLGCSRSPALAALGFAGGLLHVINHAVFKGLLFLGAGTVLHATGTREIDRLGGISTKMPRHGV